MKKQFFKIISLFLVLAIIVCGCNNNDSEVLKEIPSQTTILPVTNDGTINLTKKVTANNVSGKNADDTFINAQVDFAVNLFKKTVSVDKNKNVLISPLSATLALAMAFNGADGETKKEFERLMGNITVEQLNEYLYSYINNLDDSEIKLNIANSIWIRNGLQVKEDFLKINKNYYNADIFSTNFNADTVDDINNWASDKTNGIIKDLLSYNDIDKNTAMCLLNALLFDVNWQEIYSHSDAIQTFTNINGEEKTVQTLKALSSFYYDDGKATGFNKNYTGENFSFVTLLPNKDININDYINGLTGKELLKTLNNPMNVFANTQMPEFSYDYNCDMVKTLSDLGLPSAFNSAKANFEKISCNLYINKFIHKTKISVNEVGTKAAAASAATMNKSAALPKEYEVIIDRPFVYMIIDNKTNLPIFIGTVMEV